MQSSPVASQARGTPIPMAKPGQIDVPGFAITADDTVVDVGCGYDAPVCRYAGRLGAEVIAVDVDQAQLDCAVRAMEEIPARSFRAILSDSNPLPLPDGIATVVVATEVVEHVRDPESFLRELARIGAPGARYLISVPHPTSEAVMKRIAPDWYFLEPFHINIFQPHELDALLTRVGLTLESRFHQGFYWSMHWFLRMAIGMSDPWEDRPEHPALEAWDAVAAALGDLAADPRGAELALLLDQIIPKSQVCLARKSTGTSTRDMRAIPRPNLMKHWFRDGNVRVGGYDFQWKIRRAAGHSG